MCLILLKMSNGECVKRIANDRSETTSTICSSPEKMRSTSKNVISVECTFSNNVDVEEKVLTSVGKMESRAEGSIVVRLNHCSKRRSIRKCQGSDCLPFHLTLRICKTLE